MTLEYILLFSIFVLMLFGIFWNGPRESFVKSGPRLGARIEKNLVTGAGFQVDGGVVRWRSDLGNQ
ncbi:MAG: hypothetical protein AB7O96_11350 [Pseudobdellovibrionaceae bacterium]